MGTLEDYKEATERQFAEKKASIHTHTKGQGMTDKEAVLRWLYDHRHEGKIWFWSWEFNGQTLKDGRYLSHRACARASDLAIQDPMLVEHRPVGRFKMYRLRMENIQLIRARLGIKD